MTVVCFLFAKLRLYLPLDVQRKWTEWVKLATTNLPDYLGQTSARSPRCTPFKEIIYRSINLGSETLICVCGFAVNGLLGERTNLSIPLMSRNASNNENGNLTKFCHQFDETLNEMMRTAGTQMKRACDHRSESQFKQLRK